MTRLLPQSLKKIGYFPRNLFRGDHKAMKNLPVRVGAQKPKIYPLSTGKTFALMLDRDK